MHRVFGHVFPPNKYLRRIHKRGARLDFQQHRCKSSGLPETKFDGASIDSVETIYKRWLESPSSVSHAWDTFFRNVSQRNNDVSINNEQQGDTSKMHGSSSFRHHARSPGGGASSADSKAIDDNLAVLELIRSYQTRGYHFASLDPLGLSGCGERIPYLRPNDAPYQHAREEHANMVTEVKATIDNDKVFKLPPNTFIGGNENALPLKEIIKRLEDVYCGNVTVECGHITGVEERNWLRKKFELPGAMKLSKDLSRLTLARLIRAAGFESFSSKKFPSSKRFGGEGAEVVIPCMKQIIDRSIELGTECVIIAMAHRARLNVMANVCRIPLENLYVQFQNIDVKEPQEGDIKYHLGLNYARQNKVTNKPIRSILISNPSHLECSSAIMEGRARGEQYFRSDASGRKVVPMCVHGDAALTGQGITYEIQHLSDLPHFTTNGTIHIVLNNQLGFTTNPVDGRSSAFSSDIAKVVGVPVLHVNGDDPEAVMFAANVAAEWRAIFRRNIFLDLVVYRRYGHSEGEEPFFTQPHMYQKIAHIKPTVDLYTEKLISEGTVNEKEVTEVREKYFKLSEDAVEISKKATFFTTSDWTDNPWPEFPKSNELPPTGIPSDVLMHIATVHSSGLGKDFVLYKAFDRILKGRMDMLHKAKMFDWSIAEACAIGSILKEGLPVRLVGQDVERGTFSHRHYVLHNQSGDHGTYIPLNHLYQGQAEFMPINAPLSEYAVLGFEFGFSQCSPNCLCIWEAQFGDFSNVCQCILDNFVCCGEAKWLKQSGMVINLPHGLEGMGPDHSSARPERYLLQCKDDPNNIPTGSDAAIRQLRECNWIVAQVTTPANLFHILRRQVHMPFRKVLINMFPKSLLRMPLARSPIDECKEGTSFQRVIPDPVNPSGVKKVAFSCGKVYYDLQRARKTKKLENEIALVRIEQAHPFPYDLVTVEAAKYPNAKICFVQEESQNQGYHHYVMPRLRNVLPGKEIKIISRPPSCAGATGFPKTHQRQLNKLLEEFINF